MPKFDPSRSLEFCPAACGDPIGMVPFTRIIVDARGRRWHDECAIRALGAITRKDETRGEQYTYRWTWPEEKP